MNKQRVKVTLLLDDETLKLLKSISYEKLGETNMSKAVMLMAKSYEHKTKKDTGTVQK